MRSAKGPLFMCWLKRGLPLCRREIVIRTSNFGQAVVIEPFRDVRRAV
jgi:hypothetical protein